MNDEVVKIAKILKTDKNIMNSLCERMNENFKNNAVFNVVEENEKLLKKSLMSLGLNQDALEFELYDALLEKVSDLDNVVYELLDRPKPTSMKESKTLIDTAKEIADVPEGFFLKKEKAEEFLRNKAPLKIIDSLGYKDVDELLEKEEMMQVFAALRFVEDREWLNNEFFAQYESLTPDDFERREIELKVLDKKWLKAAESFLKKKYHNISHLKELGIIFIIPLELDVPGETMRMLSLVFHYLNEVTFYSKLFQEFSKNKETFSEELISSLRGDVLEERLKEDGKANWMIVQRYLTKEDEFDWRLTSPHINPEALHWAKVEKNITDLSKKFPELDLSFWKGLDFVAGFFKTKAGVENIVSFNLIDIVMSDVMREKKIKYNYHQKEAMWNKLFSEYVGGQDKMEKIMIENFNKGYISF